MKAIVIEQAGNPHVLQIKDVPRPQSQPGWVLINVKAFGLNRSEMFTRQGHSPSVKFPRILGIECVGVVVEAPETNFQPGQKVAAIMGGMGRDFDGSYAEYTCVPKKCVFPIETELDWSILAAIPEMFQTAWGALTKSLEVTAGQTLLIRGGTSSIGLAATHLAKTIGLTVISTTRNAAKVETLKANGVDHVIIDNGAIADSVRNIFPQGVDRVLELVGTVALIDSLKTVTPRGIICIAGCLGNEWIFKEFFPMAAIPKTVKLTTYGGGPDDLSAVDLQNFIDGVASGHHQVTVDRVFNFDEIVEAHSYMESNQATGKLVILLD